MDTDKQQKSGIVAIMIGATMVLAVACIMPAVPDGIAIAKPIFTAIVILGTALFLIGGGLWMTSFSHKEQKASS